MASRPDDADRRIVRRERPVSGPVEDYTPPEEGPDEGPSEADIARFGDVTVKCSECGTELYDDVALCWKCGRAVGAGTKDESKGPPIWVVITVLLIIAGFVFFATRGVF
jgi:hypothetical protein